MKTKFSSVGRSASQIGSRLAQILPSSADDGDDDEEPIPEQLVEILTKTEGLSFGPSAIVPADAEHAAYHVIQAPLDKNRPDGTGTYLGPSHILLGSQQISPIYQGRNPGEAGIYVKETLSPDLTAMSLIMELADSVGATLNEGKIPITLGGDHTITMGVMTALDRKYSGEPIGIIQLDAHANLRLKHEENSLSDYCVMRRIHEQWSYPVLQIGTRGLFLDEQAYRETHAGKFHVETARDIWTRGVRKPLIPADFPEKVYLSFDLSCLDPSLMPATTRPSPGGLLWPQIEDIFAKIRASGREIIGSDVVELAPIPHGHAADITAASVVYAIMDLCRER